MYNFEEKLPNGATLKTIRGKNTPGGETVTVRGEISTSGGQGDVYKVEWKGNTYALKWYNRTPEDCVGSPQFTTITRLTQKDNPDPQFYIWPQVIVTETGNLNNDKLFGYLMEVFPPGYFEMKHFLRDGKDKEQKTFASYHAMIWAGMNIVSALGSLHHSGMSYKDLNPGNIVINPKTGKIKMVDCDNISADNEPCSVSGMRGYMAPEIVRSGFEQVPNIQTDMFSLAIILFRLFYYDHPMEGKIWEDYPLITDKVEDILYCIHPVYNMSTQNDKNRPTKVYAPNVMARMAKLPKILMEGFENTFVNGIDNVMGRTPENRWLQILSMARDQLVFLDSRCETDRVVRFDNKATIPQGCLRLTVGRRRHEVAIYPMQSLFKDVVSGNVNDYNERIGWITVANRRMVMQNLSNGEWVVYDPISQQQKTVKHKDVFVVMPGTQILFDEKRKIVGKVDNLF